jgi:hypothetical protein
MSLVTPPFRQKNQQGLHKKKLLNEKVLMSEKKILLHGIFIHDNTQSYRFDSGASSFLHSTKNKM